MLPNLSRTVMRFAQPVTLKTITQTVVNHRPVDTAVDSTIHAVISPASAEILKSLTLDESLSYFSMFTTVSVGINDRIVYKTKTFRTVQHKDYSEYGYNEYVIEEVK